MSSPAVMMDPAWTGQAEIQGPPETRQEDIQGQWPRMLVLSDEVKSRLVQYLDNEIMQCWAERGVLVEDWIQWQKDYWAKPAQKVKNFPFRRAANVVIPMTAIAVEAVYARLLTTLFSVKPFYSIRAKTTDWIDSAPEIEDWFQTEIENPMAIDMDQFARESLLELIKLGTGVGKTGYERDIRKVNVDIGGTSTPKWVTVRDGSTLFYVPLANFLMRLHEKDPQSAAWVGEEHNDVSWAQVKRYALSGRMYPEAIKEIKAYFNSGGGSGSTAKQYDDSRRSDEGTELTWRDTIDFQELWLGFDVDEDGVDEEIVVDFHKESGAILSARYNWYEDLNRPYRIGQYIPVEGRWVGIGIGKQQEQFQALITTVHRQRLDAGTLANMGQLAIKKTSGYGPDEPIFPGKMWFVDNPGTDIKEFSLSNTQHFAQISNEDAARQYADKRTGVNELILGTPALGTPATATTDLAKLAEGNKKFDAVLKNVRRWYGLLGLDILANYKQFGSKGRTWLMRGKDGIQIEKYLSMPQTAVRQGAFVYLTVTDSITNKDVEQQKWGQVFAILSGHYDKAMERAIQVMQFTQDVNLFLAFAEMALSASNTALKRFLQAHQVPDIESFLLDINTLKELYGSTQGGGDTSGPPGTGNRVPPTAGGNRLLAPSGVGGNGLPSGDAFSIESS